MKRDTALHTEKKNQKKMNGVKQIPFLTRTLTTAANIRSEEDSPLERYPLLADS